MSDLSKRIRIGTCTIVLFDLGWRIEITRFWYYDTPSSQYTRRNLGDVYHPQWLRIADEYGSGVSIFGNSVGLMHRIERIMDSMKGAEKFLAWTRNDF